MPDSTAIRSFQVSFPEADVAELRRRIKMARWPEHELVSDAASRRIWSTPATVGPTQGVQLATMQKLIHDIERIKSAGSSESWQVWCCAPWR